MADELKQILLVEDNQDDIDLTLLGFKKNRIVNDVVVLRDGAEALDYLFGTGIHAGRDVAAAPIVVLLDINLPKVSGLEILKRLRSDPRTKLQPVVMLTSSIEERDLTTSYDLGVNSYIRKPVNVDNFNDAIKQVGLYWILLNELPPS